jgi:hypothetical protein
LSNILEVDVMSLKKRAVMFALALSASLLPVAVASAPAQAACPIEYYYYTTGKIDTVWIGTSAYSIWTDGPATISRTLTDTATAGSDTTVGVSVSAGTLIVKAEANFSHTWSESTSKSASWSYSITIPRGSTARARVYKKGHKIEFIEKKIGSDCLAKNTRFYLRAPLSSDDNKNYCIVRDSYPGTKFISSCSNH